MTTDGMNWVERRALMRRNKSEQAAGVWESAGSAIENCCNSFNTHFKEDAEAHCSHTGSRIHVSVWFPAAAIPGKKAKNDVIIDFDEDEYLIRVSSDSKQFKIDANERNAFIATPGGKEISIDEFSREALHDALFNPPKPRLDPFDGM